MPERILAVDDEPNMLGLLKTILTSKTNYEVVTTNNPLEAAKLLQEEPFDLLITDLKMPLMDGMDLIETVKKIDAALPISWLPLMAPLKRRKKQLRRGPTITSPNLFVRRRY